MRYLIAGGALLLAGLLAAFLILPSLVDDARIERHLAELVADMTGQRLAVDGGIDIKLLPQPLLTVHRPRVGDAAEGALFAADRLDLEVALVPLLVGRLEITDAHLVRPVLRLNSEPTAVLDAWADRLAASEGVLPWRRLGIVGGTLLAQDQSPLLQAVDGAVEREGEGSGSRIGFEGRLATGAGRLRLDGHFSRVQPGRPVPSQLQLVLTQDAVVSRLDFRGLVRLASGERGLEGRLALALPAPSTTVGLLAIDAGAAGPLLADAPLTLEAGLALDLAGPAPTIRLDEASLVVAGRQLAGDLTLALGEAPEMALALSAERLTLPDMAGPDAGAMAASLPFAIADSLPAALRGSVALRAEVVEWHARQFRQAALDIALDGAGTAAITRASAVLPGPGDLAFEGRLGPLGAASPPRLAGRLSAAVQEPAELVAAFAPPPETLRRSTTLSIDTDLAWDAAGLTLRDADLRLDALRATGAVAWRAGGEDRLPQLAAQARIDRLALDELLGPELSPAALEPLLGRLATLDLALALRAERTSFGEARFGGLVLDLDGSDGKLMIDRLSLTDIAGSAATLEGSVDAVAGDFALGLALDLASLPRLLRLFGHEPAPALALLGPLNLRAHLAGGREAATIEGTLDADRFAATGAARLDDWRSAPSGEVRLGLEAPEAAALIRQLAGVPVTDARLQGALTADLGLTLAAGTAIGADLEATLGAFEVRLDAAPAGDAAGALDRMTLQLGPLDATMGGLLYRLATPALGLVPGPLAGWLGHWPAQELDWRWLRARETELSLTLGFADPALPPLEIVGRLQDGRLTLPALRIETGEGLVEGSMALTARPDDAAADLVLDMATENLALPPLLHGLGLDPHAVTGGLALETRLHASGRSLRGLVANLGGQADLVIDGGAIAAAGDTDGIPLDRLAAALTIERGVVRPAAGGITFQGPDGVGRIDGTLDLLAWMAEIVLALDDHGGEPLARQRYFGPPGEIMAMPEPAP